MEGGNPHKPLLKSVSNNVKRPANTRTSLGVRGVCKESGRRRGLRRQGSGNQRSFSQEWGSAGVGELGGGVGCFVVLKQFLQEALGWL